MVVICESKRKPQNWADAGTVPKESSDLFAKALPYSAMTMVRSDSGTADTVDRIT
jgi:hypothetical protein